MIDTGTKPKSRLAASIQAVKSVTAADFARLLVCAAAVIHLGCAQIHVSALLKLENQICGLIMFLFILTGLLALFEAIRFKQDRLGDLILLLAALAVSSGLGAVLISIYVHAINFQRSLKTADVYNAVWLSLGILGAYLAGGALVVAGRLRRRRGEQDKAP